MIFRRPGPITTIELPPPLEIGRMEPEGFDMVNDILPPGEMEMVVFDSMLRFVGHSVSEARAKKLEPFARTTMEQVLAHPAVEVKLQPANFPAVKFQHTITQPGAQRMLNDDQVLDWHNDSTSVLAANALTSTYAWGTLEVSRRDSQRQSLGSLLRNYHMLHQDEGVLALPDGLTTFTPDPFAMVLQGSYNAHKSSVNITEEPIDSTLVAVLPLYK